MSEDGSDDSGHRRRKTKVDDHIQNAYSLIGLGRDIVPQVVKTLEENSKALDRIGDGDDVDFAEIDRCKKRQRLSIEALNLAAPMIAKKAHCLAPVCGLSYVAKREETEKKREAKMLTDITNARLNGRKSRKAKASPVDDAETRVQRFVSQSNNDSKIPRKSLEPPSRHLRARLCEISDKKGRQFVFPCPANGVIYMPKEVYRYLKPATI